MDVEIRTASALPPHGRYSLSPSRIINIAPTPKRAQDTTIRDKAKLLQLAERIQTKKSSNTPSYGAQSFRAAPSCKNVLRRHSTNVNGNNNDTSERLFAKKGQTNVPSTTPVKSSSKNPKFYASFSTKNSSSKKISKSLIDSDPAKTNIEHLVNYKATPVNHQKLESNTNGNEQCDNNGGLSNFMTPLKALHASFHDRAKLASAFSPRNKLFSQREKTPKVIPLAPVVPDAKTYKYSGVTNGFSSAEINHQEISDNNKNAFLNDIVNENRCLSPDYLDYYGNSNSGSEPPNVLQNLHENGRSSSRILSTTPDILGDCLEYEYDSELIIKPNHNSEKEQYTNSENEELKGSYENLEPGKIGPTQIYPEVKTSRSKDKGRTANSKKNDYNFTVEISGNNEVQKSRPQSMLRTAGSSTWLPTNNHHIEVTATTRNSNSYLLAQKNHNFVVVVPSLGVCKPSVYAQEKSETDGRFRQEKDDGSQLSEMDGNSPKSSSTFSHVFNDLNGNRRETCSSVYVKQTPIPTCDDYEIKYEHCDYREPCETSWDGNDSSSDYAGNLKSAARRLLVLQHNPALELTKRSRNTTGRNNFPDHQHQSRSFRYPEGRDGGKYPKHWPSMDKFERKRSSSLPKSFMSIKNDVKSTLPSLWTRGDELVFGRLDDRQSSCPDPPVNQSFPYETVKMRWPKPATGSSSQCQTPLPLAKPPESSRPMSLDYSQKKDWMRVYRNMEVSSAAASTPKSSSKCSKGRIAQVNVNDSDNVIEDTPEPNSKGIIMPIAKRPPEACGLSPSLFQRFSKTFSLRFGSGTSNSTPTNNGKSPNRKSKMISAPIGSSPDLYHRGDIDGNLYTGGKMRKGDFKAARGDKCQSGDSGIGMMDEPQFGKNRLRRIRSDFIDTSSQVPVSSNPTTNLSPNGPRMSVVEIPDHVWRTSQRRKDSKLLSITTANTTSYEDLLDAKLDDDGFISNDEHEAEDYEDDDEGGFCAGTDSASSYYHSLPHKYSRKRGTPTHSDQKPPGLKTHSLEVDCSSSSSSSSSSGSTSGHSSASDDNSIRSKVIKEIVATETNYVKTLNDIVHGFLLPCRERRDLFSEPTVRNIFSNIEQILRLHAKFLKAIKSKLDNEAISRSSIGAVFTDWADKFDLYSDYCCNNPISMATVRNLSQNIEYAEFFEACRRLQVMDKLPLHGFLLRPIQRICQYHLQLNELLKQTEKTHEDYDSVVEALETMKAVAMKINDTQRQFDALQDIIRLQNSVDGWDGPDLIDRNASVLQKGELLRMTYGRKHKEVFVALLNKELIYCKKDFIKKNGYVYDGRIDLEQSVWLNIDSNEEDEYFGMVHNSWRIYSPDRSTWMLFTAPNPTEKRKWITALEKTADEIPIDRKMREMAKVTAALSEAEANLSGSHGPSSHNSNTLPKSKKSKGKHGSVVTRLDSDTILMEVGKLKRSPYASSSKERTSKFYV